MTAIHAPSTVLARIAAIQAQFRPAAAAGDATDAEPSTVGFDPFGAAYQAALDQVGAAPPDGADASAAPQRLDTLGGRAVRTGPTSWSAASGSAPRAGALSGDQVARMAYQAGFRGEDLVNVVAISKRESGWSPSAFNGDASTGDRSYGLMQINMIGDLGPARLRQFGLSSNEQLLDPQTNLNAAYRMYADAGGSLNAWGGYKGLSNTFNTDTDAARAVVAAAGLVG